MIKCRKIPTAVSDGFCTVGMTAKTELSTLLVAEFLPNSYAAFKEVLEYLKAVA